MRPDSKRVNRFRIREGRYGSDDTYGNTGAFIIQCFAMGRHLNLKVIASFGGGWDHVSVSCPDRCPTWEEMCYVKDLFFDDEECVVQFHPPKSQYVNYHPRTLHLWRPQAAEERARLRDDGPEFPAPGPLPMPPPIFVGPKTNPA